MPRNPRPHRQISPPANISPERIAMLKLKPALAALLLLGIAAPLAAQPAPAPAAQAGGASLTLAFTGIERPTGAIMIALFDSDAGWTGNRPVRTAMVSASGAN